MNTRRFSFWRWLALLLTLLLVPAVCVMAAFASQLQITSPYFSLSFGPPRTQGEPPMIVWTGGRSLPPLVNVESPEGTPPPPPGTGGPQQPPSGNNPTAASPGCKGVACVNLGLSGQGGDVDLQVGAEVPVLGTQLSVDANAGSQGVQVETDVDSLGNSSNQTNPNDEGLNLNLLNAVQVGVGGGTGGVSIGLNLPGLLP